MDSINSIGEIPTANKKLAQEVMDRVTKIHLGEAFEGKFYLAFAYKDHENVDTKHITHTYCGELDSFELTKLIQLCDNYFNANPFKGFKVEMNQEEFFGPEKDIRVLRPLKPSDDSSSYLPKLSKLLKDFGFNRSAFKDEKYKPHTTTDLPEIKDTINRIGIYSGNSIVKEWMDNTL